MIAAVVQAVAAAAAFSPVAGFGPPAPGPGSLELILVDMAPDGAPAYGFAQALDPVPLYASLGLPLCSPVAVRNTSTAAGEIVRTVASAGAQAPASTARTSCHLTLYVSKHHKTHKTNR